MNGSGNEATEVMLIADELARAVELTLNPSVSHDSRLQAYNACESFKENSPWCAQAGLLLASGGQFSAVVKHFGLQLMEHTVKYRWTQISQAEKIFIKENSMKLLYLGGWDTGHLNDALARVIVEMIKREWPQQWPTLLVELSDACARGHVHTQIVLHVFLRLVEDVATLQTLEQHQRRKDIYQALTSNMAEIFGFFMRLIELHVQEFREKTSAGDFVGASSNERVVQVVLLTLTGFVEWVSTNHVVMNNGRLLQILCILLQDDAFRLPAAECLLQVVNRKGSTKERKPLLILFSEDAMSCIHRAALATINVADEKHYLFLKKLSQVLVGLGQQLTSLWTYATNVDSWMPVYLETLLVISSHPSLSLAHTCNSVWLMLYKHEHVCKLPALLARVPRWLQLFAPKLLKVSYPSTRVNGVNDAVTYAGIDYDSEQEFAIFFSRSRTEMLESFKYCMTAAPLVTWSYVEQWTRGALDKVPAAPLHVDQQHPIYIEWEALSQVLDVVLSRLVTCEPRPDVTSGLQLLQGCINSDVASPLLLSLMLSFISALFVFLSCASSQLAGPSVGSVAADLLPRVLDKIFSALAYGDETETRRTRAVKNVRRHAASLLVKLASKYPLLLLPVFGRVEGLVRNALSRPGLSAVEAVTLQEALLLLANHLCCFERQSALVQQILGDSAARWAALSVHITTPEGFERLVGLDQPPEDPALDNGDGGGEAGVARRTLLHATALVLGVVKRTHIPDDPDKASRGGFNGGVTPSGNPMWRNPCSAHVLPLLPHVLSLARVLHQLHVRTRQHARHPGHAKVLCLPPAEIHNLLGIRDHDNVTTVTQDRMQNFLHTLHENVCHIVGCAAATLGRELFCMAGLVEALGGSLLQCASWLPEHWLRPLVRAALRPLLAHAATKHHKDIAKPLVATLAPIMLEILTRRWEYITTLYESGKLEEEGSSDAQEVLDDILVRNLTREYAEVLKIILVGGSIPAESVTGDMEEESAPPPARATEALSELGALLLADPPTQRAILQTLYLCVTCMDSISSLRACALLPACVRGCVLDVLDADAACGALACTLHALRTHGQHDANQAALLHAALTIYETLRPQFPSVLNVMRAIPDVDAHDLNRLDEKLSAAVNKPAKIDKSKRDLFKKITAKLIGRNVGQLFKKEVYIKDLPTMPSAPKEKPRNPLDGPESTGLEGLFKPNAPT